MPARADYLCGASAPRDLRHIALNPSHEDRYCEYVDHLHEHFVYPVRVEDAHYRAPLDHGYSAEMKEASLAAHEFPGGKVWSA